MINDQQSHYICSMKTDESIQQCLIRKSWKMCSDGVPPGTVLGNIGLCAEQ